MSRVLLLMALVATAFAFPVASAESVFSSYRGITLGDSVQVVVDQLKAVPSDVKVVHARPTLVQQLSWRPRQFVSGVSIQPDPVAEMILTFHLGRLARIAVIYERDRTRGLTDADLHDALSGVYGTSMLLSTPIGTSIALPVDLQAIGRWGDSETLVLLWREAYPERVRLTITAIDADRAMQEALVDGMRLETSEAPARDVARRAAEAAALRARDENVRRDNKAAFKP
jgi:hypothetical protein